MHQRFPKYSRSHALNSVCTTRYLFSTTYTIQLVRLTEGCDKNSPGFPHNDGDTLTCRRRGASSGRFHEYTAGVSLVPAVTYAEQAGR